jgi:hypothetical protein
VRGLALLAVVALTGCHPFPGQAWEFTGDTSLAPSCSVPGTGGFYTVDGSNISCAALTKNVALAKSMLEQADLLQENEFASIFSGISAVVYPVRCINSATSQVAGTNGESGSCIYGDYSENQAGVGFFELNSYGQALLHEYIHAIQYAHGDANDSANHVNWGPLGYFNLSDEYSNQAFAFVPGT